MPGVIDILGSAVSDATVTVNSRPTIRHGSDFFRQLAVNNAVAPQFPEINVVAVKNNAGTGGADLVAQQSGRYYLPKTPEVFTYDDDGNLLTDGRWSYTWGGENRLIAMESIAAVPASAKARLEFAYDSQSRRISKKTYSWTGSAYALAKELRFLYDDWNLIASLDDSNDLVQSYTWGLDLSGTLQGAGGVGGLMMEKDAASGKTYLPTYDGNGNVVRLVQADTASVEAIYEYDPFGKVVSQTGSYSAENPWRFSTKTTDEETGLVYYGYRYFNPVTGRWLNRDPLEEKGGMNLYVFVLNSPVNSIDPLGLQPGFFQPELIVGMVSKKQLEEFYGLIDSINAVKSKAGEQCYSVDVHIDPVSSAVIKALAEKDLTDKVVIFAHGSPDGRITLTDGQFKVSDLTRSVEAAGKGCSYVACYISPLKGRIAQSGMLQSQIDELKKIRAQLEPQPSCCTKIRIQYVTGPR